MSDPTKIDRDAYDVWLTDQDRYYGNGEDLVTDDERLVEYEDQ